jgi:hypothetical protein
MGSPAREASAAFGAQTVAHGTGGHRVGGGPERGPAPRAHDGRDGPGSRGRLGRCSGCACHVAVSGDRPDRTVAVAWSRLPFVARLRAREPLPPPRRSARKPPRNPRQALNGTIPGSHRAAPSRSDSPREAQGDLSSVAWIIEDAERDFIPQTGTIERGTEGRRH